jgi:phage terminase large subunit GpA-like protein
MVQLAEVLPEGYDIEDALRRTEVASAELVRDRLRPPPRLTVSEWADRYRILPDTSPHPGQWDTDRAPYLKGVMDACSDPDTERVVFQKPSQVGGTEGINNVLGYFIDQDPAPILVVQYSVDEAHKWSKERFAKMVKDTPRLQGKIASPKSRDSDNTILSKSFPGGHLGVVGANAPSGLSARPRRVILLDEVDRFPPSAGTEGDPVDLAITRASAFWNRLIFMNSSPGMAGLSRIHAAYLETDQRQFYVPCPSCGGYQVLAWANLRWEKDDRKSGPARHLPETARYACPSCGDLISEKKKPQMVRAGEWRPTNPDAPDGWVGFQLNALNSLLARWPDLVRKFVAATSPEPNPEKLQVFVNTVLGEPFEAAGVKLDPSDLEKRASEETYSEDPLPEEVAVITAGVDIQDDRIEVVTYGWGPGEESWALEHHVIYGDPSINRMWDEDLDHVLQRVYPHPLGVRLRISAVGVDSGHYAQQAYRFCKAREARRVWAVKGVGTIGAPLMDRPTRSNKYKTPLFKVGTDAAKTTIYSRLQLEKPGPGFCHHRPDFDEEFFRQLTAEKRRRRKNRRGFVVAEWVLPPGRRNEVLDCTVYALAALEGLTMGGMNLDRVAEYIRQAGKKGKGKKAPAKRRRHRILSEGVA